MSSSPRSPLFGLTSLGGQLPLAVSNTLTVNFMNEHAQARSGPKFGDKTSMYRANVKKRHGTQQS